MSEKRPKADVSPIVSGCLRAASFEAGSMRRRHEPIRRVRLTPALRFRKPVRQSAN
jgi:hypothetical protein